VAGFSILKHNRRSNDISLLAEYLRDYPDRYPGNVEGLIERSIEWHRENPIVVEQERIQISDDAEAVLPPIPLPDDPNISFLKDVKAIRTEGKKMYHCIAGYSQNAIQGEVYLFHVDLDGDEASVMVDRNGKVLQSKGPCNAQNKASKWGALVLGEWGKSLMQIPTLDKPDALEGEF